MKKTLQEKLLKRKYKQPSKFLWWGLNNLVLRPFLAPPLHIEYDIRDNINECKTGAFIVYNHQSRADYTWITQCIYPRRCNFVVGYNEFFRSHLYLIAKLLHFIPKKKLNIDIPSNKAMAKIITDNGVVCIAPEGMSSIVGHNQPVALGTAKLLKHHGVPVYACVSHGGYLFNHKVCLDNRYGKVKAEFFLLFSKEDLERMTLDEITDKLNETLWVDDYEWQKKEHVLWKTKGRIATHLHDICYKCPKCGTEFEMLGEGNTLVCKHCGNGAKMNDYYEFEPFEGAKLIDTPSHWTDWERKEVFKEIQDPSYEFKEKVKIGKIPTDHLLKKVTSEICGEGEVTINHEGFFYKGTKDGEPFEFKLEYGGFPTTVMTTTVEQFGIYYNGEYYDLYPERPSSMKITLIVEEMHRMHINAWKNFKWAKTYDEDPNSYEITKE